ncbi:hypothetical protein BOTBODRAFT_324234 [Botryobasidium botryosum FD-172 SS1]|uniref:Uncharacterized protein n=1 Tax=Botryobasidium botryosum (strain FD-172 SS1) TaxID=930990 RepID=A0A067MZD3_BOTB1|nr:hypothetical protein BOTBODRAFT_324234 [Botryobasidium botryosum FD-172 SS1]
MVHIESDRSADTRSRNARHNGTSSQKLKTGSLNFEVCSLGLNSSTPRTIEYTDVSDSPFVMIQADL